MMKFTSPLECTRPQIYFLQILGIFRCQWDTTDWFDQLHKYVAIGLRIIFIYVACLVQFLAVFQAHNLEEAIDIGFLSINYFHICYKYSVLFDKEEKILKLWQSGANIYFIPIHPAEERLLKKAISQSLIVWIVLVIFAASTVVLLIIVPLLEDGYQLFLPIWLPFRIDNGGYKYYTMYIYQVISICISGAYYVGANSVSYSLMTLTDYHIQLLGIRLKQFGYGNEFDGTKRYDQLNQMIEFIKMHREIKRCVANFKDIFNSYLLVQIIKSIFLISVIILQLMTMEFGTGAFFASVCYLLAMLVEMYEYCWLGNDIIYSSEIFGFISNRKINYSNDNFKINRSMCGRPENIRKCVYGLDEFGWDYFGLLLLLALKSNQLPTCAYFSNFIIFDKKTGDALRLLMQMTTVNAILIKTDGIGIFNFPFSFETFLMILKTSYSYIAVFKKR